MFKGEIIDEEYVPVQIIGSGLASVKMEQTETLEFSRNRINRIC